MKTTEFKNLIKTAVKEAIQEELKEILLEAVRSPKTTLVESTKDTYAQPYIEQPKTLTPKERHAMFSGILGDIKEGKTINSQYAGTINPTSTDTINGALPEGNVGLDQILGLLKK
jgi:hypothetical protein